MSKSNGLTVGALADRMAELTELHDENEKREWELKHAAKGNSDLLPAYHAATRFTEEIDAQVQATEDMIRTTPAKSLADAGLHIAIALDFADYIYDCAECRHQKRDAMIVQRLLRSAGAAIANNGVEMHAICRTHYGSSNRGPVFEPPKLPELEPSDATA